ncbi:hypothetical protein BDW68DRAFT_95828 [Aspergillus falconensis]
MVPESLKTRWHCLSPQDFYLENPRPRPETRQSTAMILTRHPVLYRSPTDSQQTKRKGCRQGRSIARSKAMEDEVPGQGATPGIEAKPRWRSWRVGC